MKKYSGNCVLSYGLLASEPIKHDITTVGILNNSYIVSGDKNGHMFIWNANENDEFKLKWMLIGHNGKIEVLSEIGDSCFVSVSRNKEMGIWNADEGKCLRMDRNLQYEHRFIKNYSNDASLKSSLLFCCGRYPGVHVLDRSETSVKLMLQSQAHPNWLVGLCCFQHKQAPELCVVLGLSVCGAVTMWTIDEKHQTQLLDIRPYTNGYHNPSISCEIIYETESKLLSNLRCPLSINICPDKARVILIVCKNVAQIYDAASWTLLSESVISSSSSTNFTGGYYINSTNILLFSELGESAIYRVGEPDNLLDNMKVTKFGTGLIQTSPSSEICCVGYRDEDIILGLNGGRIRLVRKVGNVIESSIKELWPSKGRFCIVLSSITCCLCSRDGKKVYLGTQDGQVCMGDLLETCVALVSGESHLPAGSVSVFGDGQHQGSVLCFSEVVVEESEGSVYLWSGGVDFCVRLWQVSSVDSTGKCVRELHCHSASVVRLIPQPPYPTNVSRSQRVGNAANTTSTIVPRLICTASTNEYTNLVVSIDEQGGLCLVSLSQRRVLLTTKVCLSSHTFIGWRSDQLAFIVSSADGQVSVWDITCGSLDRIEPSGQVASDLLDSCIGVACLTASPNNLLDVRPATVAERLKERSICQSPMSLQIIGKLMFLTIDTESLLLLLYNNNNSNNLSFSSRDVILIAQLILSLTNCWGDDPSLDLTLTRTLGLLPPPASSSPSPKLAPPSNRIIIKPTLVNINTNCISILTTSSSSFSFSSSPILTPEPLISAVSICHAISSLPDRLIPDGPWPKLSHVGNAQNNQGQGVTQARQVCCLLATSLATTSLPPLIQNKKSWNVVRDVLQPLLLKYQDRCIETRDGARTLLHAALDSLSAEERWNFVRWWIGMNLGEPASVSNLSHLIDDHDNEANMENNVLLLLLGVLASRYGYFFSPAGGGNDDEWNMQLGRLCAHKLMNLLTNNKSRTGLQWPMMRRASLSLLGSGFGVWEPHLDAATLFQRLLEIAATAERALSGWTTGQLLSDEADAGRTSRGAIHAVAFLRPKVFATVLSIEVLRMQSQSSSTQSSSSGSSSSTLLHNSISTNHTTGMTAASSLSSSSSSSPSSPALLAARHEVLQVLKQLCERKTKEVHDVLPEIMDILLACLNKIELRQYELQQLFPPILLFRPVASHQPNGKVVVGTRSGVVVFYDIKVGKYSASSGHKGSVTSVTFGPDGRQVASYSMPDNSICIWQLTSSGLFGMGSSHSARLVSTLSVSPIAIADNVSQEDSGLLLWLEWTETKALHLVTSSGLINKIKL